MGAATSGGAAWSEKGEGGTGGASGHVGGGKEKAREIRSTAAVTSLCNGDDVMTRPRLPRQISRERPRGDGAGRGHRGQELGGTGVKLGGTGAG